MTVVDLYTIQIVDTAHGETLTASRLLDSIMLEAEQNITDLLPPGFVAVVRRWDNPGTEDENDE